RPGEVPRAARAEARCIARAEVARCGRRYETASGGAARHPARAASDLLRRLPRAPGLLGHEAGRAGHRTTARLHGCRLPLLRLLRAVLARQYAARLRHEPRVSSRRRADLVAAPG